MFKGVCKYEYVNKLKYEYKVWSRYEDEFICICVSMNECGYEYVLCVYLRVYVVYVGL